MDTERVLKLIAMIRKLNDHGKKISSKLELEKCDRIVRRLDSFSKDCKFCERLFDEFEAQIFQLVDKNGTFDKQDFKNHRIELNRIVKHFQDQHNLVSEGYYISVYITLGLGIGMVFGITILDNLAIGISLGMLFGVVLGTSLDTNAKKKGLTI